VSAILESCIKGAFAINPGMSLDRAGQ
jgi:hypothetical protein